MNRMKCVLALALGAGMAAFATGCAIQPASGEGDTNAADVSPTNGTDTSAFHKIPPGQGEPQPGDPGVYPWPSPWYGPQGNVPSAEMTNQYTNATAAAEAQQTQVGGDPEPHRASTGEVARTPNSANQPNTGPDPSTLKQKP